MAWTIIQAILSIAGSVLGLWALLRSYWMERPKIAVVQKDDAGYNLILGRGDKLDPVLVTLLISNKSSRSNSVLRYEAAVMLSNNTSKPLNATQGEITRTPDSKALGAYNVIPLNLPAHTTTEAHLVFLLEATSLPNPIRIIVAATDMHGKRHEVSCSVPKVYPQGL